MCRVDSQEEWSNLSRRVGGRHDLICAHWKRLETQISEAGSKRTRVGPLEDVDWVLIHHSNGGHLDPDCVVLWAPKFNHYLVVFFPGTATEHQLVGRVVVIGGRMIATPAGSFLGPLTCLVRLLVLVRVVNLSQGEWRGRKCSQSVQNSVGLFVLRNDQSVL